MLIECCFDENPEAFVVNGSDFDLIFGGKDRDEAVWKVDWDAESPGALLFIVEIPERRSAYSSPLFPGSTMPLRAAVSTASTCTSGTLKSRKQARGRKPSAHNCSPDFPRTGPAYLFAGSL